MLNLLNFYDKYINLCASQNKSPSKVAEEIGLSRPAVSSWKTGKVKPSDLTMLKIAAYFNVSVEYLKSDWEEAPLTLLADNIIPIPKTKKVPLVGKIACGEPILAEENFDGTVNIPDYIDADFALTCKGDSMRNARILDGDIVFIRQQPDVENGEIAAVLIDGEATLKRVYKQNNSLILHPENSAYSPIVITGEDLNGIRILGKAVYFVSAIK